MDANRFDALSRALTGSRSRRTTLRGLLGALLGGTVLGPSGRAFATHGCRHAGANCAAPGQCCTGRCLNTGRCSCDADNPCPSPTNPCKTADCSSTGRCVKRNLEAGAACPDDGNPCTADACDGAGACAHPPKDAGTACPDDGNSCTQDICNAAGTCTHPLKTNGATCGDGKICCGGVCQETDLLTDPKNCGRCGNGCASGSCLNGACSCENRDGLGAQRLCPATCTCFRTVEDQFACAGRSGCSTQPCKITDDCPSRSFCIECNGALRCIRPCNA